MLDQMQIKEARESAYESMINGFYGMLTQYVAEGKAPEPDDFWGLGLRSLLQVLIDRIQDGHAVLEQKGPTWFFWFSGTRPYYEDSPFPFRKGIVLSLSLDERGWRFAYAHARVLAKAFGVQLHIHKARRIERFTRAIRHHPFFVFAAPLPA